MDGSSQSWQGLSSPTHASQSQPVMTPDNSPRRTPPQARRRSSAGHHGRPDTPRHSSSDESPPYLRGDQVTDYLKKKGFTKTEAVFRQETAHLGPDGRPALRAEDSAPKKYLRAFVMLRDWIDKNLDIYKVSRPRARPPVAC